MLVKLTELKGCENLPQKVDISKMQILHPNWQDHRNMGKNEILDQLSNCAVVLDEDEIRLMIIAETLKPEFLWGRLAKAICANPDKVIRIERIKP